MATWRARMVVRRRGGSRGKGKGKGGGRARLLGGCKGGRGGALWLTWGGGKSGKEGLGDGSLGLIQGAAST